MKRLYARLCMMLELVRFSHTIFALPFAVLATIMAIRVPLPDGSVPVTRVLALVGILLCMVFARTAAMAFNRLVDHQLDKENPRTAGRHLPAGLASRKEVWSLTAFSSVGFIASTLLFLPNALPLVMSIPVLAFLFGYSLSKRFTAAAHLWLGIALSLAPICVWVALRGSAIMQQPSDLMPAVMLAAAVAFWVAGFDIIYACQDADYDVSKGLHSIPARFGIAGGLRIAAVLHGLMVLTLLSMPSLAPQLSLGVIYYLTVVGIAVMLAYEHWLVRPSDLNRIGVAFFNMNAIISVVLLIATGFDCWW